MTDSFGARLRRERERRTIDIAQVAARTKIKASLFEALERDDVSQWPAGLFRRSFIRAYAEAIGLDPQATLCEFMQHFPDPSEPLAPRPGQPGPRQASSPSTPLDFPEPRTAARNDVPAEPSGRLGSTELAAALRLTLAEADMPFQRGRALSGPQARWIAAACDMTVVLTVALILFAIVERFWMPLGITALSYYIGGILLLGNSPGSCLLAPKEAADTVQPSEPARAAARPRHADPGPGRGRAPEPARSPFRAPRRTRTTRT
jgi:transcriptional regulator with XRE-family HTH domain